MGRVCGIGLLVSPQHVITCAHVAADALFVDREATQPPTGSISIDLPFAKGGSSGASILSEGWFPRGSGDGLDLAVLYTSHALTADAANRLSPAVSLSGRDFVAWVAQEGHEQNLICVKGTVELEIANHRYVLNVRDSNYKIRPGCSGAPAIDPASGLILGLIVQEELDTTAHAGFLIPAHRVRRALRQANISAPTITGLDALYAWSSLRYASRPRLRAQILRLIEHYGDRPDERRAFVGRARVISDLNEWLAQCEHRFLLLSGAAGRGKSTLMLHWLARIVTRADVTVFYLPIRIGFGIADELSGIGLLFAALADVFGEMQENFPQEPQVEDYLDKIALAWSCMAAYPEERFLLVVDGVDEAINQWFLARHILPPILPGNLHVVASARHKPGHEDGGAWLSEFGAQLSDVRLQAHVPSSLLLEITTLDRAAMADAVVQLGHPLHRLAERQAFVDALYWLTDQGDPLLLTLWLGQIWRQRDRAPDLDADALNRCRPSFSGFYERWMHDQQLVWKANGLDIHPNDFGVVMCVLAISRGPMSIDDLIAVLRHLNNDVLREYRKLRAALESAHRLLVGDDTSGYALLHPRLAQHFRDERSATGAVRLRVLRRAFRSWGAETVCNLNRGALSPEECPRYLLSHYAHSHIEVGDDHPLELLNDYYLPLLQRGWPRACLAHESSWEGYLYDLQRVAEGLHIFNETCIRQNCRRDLRLALQFRCALLRATAHSLTKKLPPDLVILLAKKGMWSTTRAARVASLYEPELRARCMTELVRTALSKKETAEATQIMHGALEAVTRIPNETLRAAALGAMTMQLWGQSAISKRVFEIAMAIADEPVRVKALTALARQLSGQDVLLGRVLELVADVKDQLPRGELLHALATRLQPEHAAWKRANDLATTIGNEVLRIKVLSALAVQMQGESRQAGLRMLLEKAASIADEPSRAAAVSEVTAHLSDETALTQALQFAAAIDDNVSRAKVLGAVCERLHGPGALLARMLDLTAQIEEEHALATALRSIAAPLQAEPVLLARALELAASIQHEWSRARALRAIVGRCDRDRGLSMRALDLVGLIGDERARAEGLRGLGDWPQDGPVSSHRLLGLAADFEQEWPRVIALTAIATQLYESDALSKALELAAAIENEVPRAMALAAVARRIYADRSLLAHTLDLVEDIVDERSRAEVLCAVVVRLTEERDLLARALELAAAIGDQRLRETALITVIAQMQGEHTLLQQGLKLAGVIGDELPRVKALCAVSEELGGEEALLVRSLEIAAVAPEPSQVDMFSVLAPQLQGHVALLSRALTIATEIKDWDLRYGVMAVLRPVTKQSVVEADAHPPDEDALAVRVQEIVSGWHTEWSKAWFLKSVVEQSQGKQNLLTRVLEAAATIDDRELAFSVLSPLAAKSQGELKCGALAAAFDCLTSIDNEWSRAIALKDIASSLAGESTLLHVALGIAENITNELARAEALGALASASAGETSLLGKILAFAVKIEEELPRIGVISAVVASLENQPSLHEIALRASLTLPATRPERIAISSMLMGYAPNLLTYQVWFDWLTHAELSRQELLSVAGHLTRAAIALTGRVEVGREIADAINDVCDWWC